MAHLNQGCEEDFFVAYNGSTWLQGVSEQLQHSLITSVQASLQNFVDRGEVAVDQLVFHLQTSGVLAEVSATCV